MVMVVTHGSPAEAEATTKVSSRTRGATIGTADSLVMKLWRTRVAVKVSVVKWVVMVLSATSSRFWTSTFGCVTRMLGQQRLSAPRVSDGDD